MHRYEIPARKPESKITGDQRSGARRLFDSSLTKFLRVLSIAFGVWVLVGILFGIMVIFSGLANPDMEEEEFESRRRQFGFTGLGLVASGVVAGYGSYRAWLIADKAGRANRRRAKGLN